MDTRPYHDHGSFKGPCSDMKHKAIKTLNPFNEGYDREGNLVNPLLAFSIMLANYIEAVRFTEDGPACACCKALIM